MGQNQLLDFVRHFRRGFVRAVKNFELFIIMRRKKSIKRTIDPDPLYGNALLAKFINHLMGDGKKTVARRVVYDALNILAAKEKKAAPQGEPHSDEREATKAVTLFESAITNVAPAVEVKSRRVGGATYQVPREVRGDRRITLAIRWILQAARANKGKPMAERLAEELLLASRSEGAAFKKKLDTHRMAEANKAFAHFAW